MEYFPINNASKYYKKEELKNIFPQAIKTLKLLLQHPRKRFSGIPIKPFNNLKKRIEGIETYIEYFDYKIQIGYYLNRLIQKSLKNNLISLNKYKPTLTWRLFFWRTSFTIKKISILSIIKTFTTITPISILPP